MRRFWIVLILAGATGCARAGFECDTGECLEEDPPPCESTSEGCPQTCDTSLDCVEGEICNDGSCEENLEIQGEPDPDPDPEPEPEPCDGEEPNACGGCTVLAEAPGAVCGVCSTGAMVCDGTDAVVCDETSVARAIAAEPGERCGNCGEYVCDETGLVCDDPGFNACGGCDALPAAVGDPCGACGQTICAGPNGLSCDDTGNNACGGCTALPTLGDPCGDCGSVICDGEDDVTCSDPGMNSCGGCATFISTLGDACGDCGQLVCAGTEMMACDDPGENVCGGCAELVTTPGESCGDCGVVECDGPADTLCNDPGTNACGGCADLGGEPDTPCGTCGMLACDGPDALQCEQDPSPPSYGDRILPSSSVGAGCNATDEWFHYGSCTDSKTYDVTAGAWIGLAARGDSCGGCVLYHIAFDIQEDLGAGWVTMEHHDPTPDAKGMFYNTSYRPQTSQVRVVAPAGFYLKVYAHSVPNGGFEAGTEGFTLTSGVQTPALETHDDYVANRGEFSVGDSGGGGVTYFGSDAELWRVSTSVCGFVVGAGSKLTFDTYGDDSSCYAHWHALVSFSDGTSSLYDSYTDYCAGVAANYSFVSLDLGSDAGKSVTGLDVSFHKDHSGYSRFVPTIYIDNINLR